MGGSDEEVKINELSIPFIGFAEWEEVMKR